ncbi:cyclin-D-binding Myb-like transcription factor 1 isoform X2 [Tachypleus tridentatus]|uniref:cyclin-D-binding Myb-like transcription factor 1 isoform X2 n=1 Tax=Tachypleus tridentatus TaxID=6853 RepID=UPI003FD658F8
MESPDDGLVVNLEATTQTGDSDTDQYDDGTDPIEEEEVDAEDEEEEVECDDNQENHSSEELPSVPHPTENLTFQESVDNVPSTGIPLPEEIVVITQEGGMPAHGMFKLDSDQEISVSCEEPSPKRLCLDTDGQTYILTIPDGAETLANAQPGLLAAAPQVVNGQGVSEMSSNENDVNQAWFTSRQDKTSLQSKGHIWKQGMWSKDEVEILESNIRHYCEQNSITDPATVIFEMSKDERKDFYRTIAKGLNRPLFSVYRRVLRMYDLKNHVGKYTPEELEQLKQLRKVHGNDWQTIGVLMGRSASSIKDRCRLMKDNCNQGKWLPAEEKRLADSVYELSNAFPGEMISSGLSWAAVAERVGTRSEKQCRTKWLNYLNWKEAGGVEWTKEDDITLICRVYSLGATDESHVDWSELAKGWSSVRSPQWLRGKWWALKRHVPDANKLPFPENCDYLYKHYAEKIRLKEEAAKANLASVAPHAIPVVETHPARVISRQTPNILRSVVTTPLAVPVQTVASAPVPQALTTTIPVHSLATTTVAPPTTITAIDPSAAAIAASSMGVPPIMQTLEVMPQTVQLTPTSTPQTFLLAHSPQLTIPFTTSVTPNQIIIHAVAPETLHGNENVTVQLNPSPHVIISTTGLSSLATEHLTSVPLTSDQMTSTSDVPPGIGSDEIEDSQESLMGGEPGFEAEEIEDSKSIVKVEEIEENLAVMGDQPLVSESSVSANMYIYSDSDPMLAGNTSPELMCSTSDVEAEKTRERGENPDPLSSSEG